MAILNDKEAILDVQLTDLGRDLLAKNQLEFAYYAFSDEGIDYSGSLTFTNFTGSIDNIVFRNMAFPSTQKRNNELGSFLYTSTENNNKMPQLVVSISTGSFLQLKRRYKTWTRDDFAKVQNTQAISKPIDVVVKANATPVDRVVDYVIEQNVLPFISRSTCLNGS